jgi:aldehyde dehydrogenase (NAD+)
MKVAPAIATGNAMIVKPSEYNCFGTLYLGELATKAGIPDGLVNIISGGGDVGIALSHHPRIRKISFTGSPTIGRLIQKAAAESNLKRVTLELGGKSPVLIFQDADINNAVQHAMAYLAFNGQGCCLGTRLIVEKPIAAQFVALLKEKTEAYASTLGVDPMSATTVSGPIFHHKQRDAVLKVLEHGQKTATLVTGGCAWGKKGCYILPTIFLEPRADSKIHKEEIFGPVVTVETFETEKEAIALANDTEYGLAGYVYTGSIDRSLRVSKALEVGTVSVNTAMLTHITLPFGGWKGKNISLS